MSGAGPVPPDLPSMRALLGAARAIGGAHGATLALCLLTVCLPWEAVAIRLEEVRWNSGTVTVPSRGRRGRIRTIALSSAAMQLLLALAGAAGASGQAVTAGDGPPLRNRDVRLDRMQDRLRYAVPGIGSVGWNFHGIRAAGAGILAATGVAHTDVAAMLGLGDGQPPGAMADDRTHRAVATAEIWSRILLTEVRPDTAIR